MADFTRIWRVIVSTLLIVLILATTMGMVWHHHDQCSTANCTLCHLVIASPAVGIGAIGLALVSAGIAIRNNHFDSRYFTTEKPPRAPPV